MFYALGCGTLLIAYPYYAKLSKGTDDEIHMVKTVRSCGETDKETRTHTVLFTNSIIKVLTVENVLVHVGGWYIIPKKKFARLYLQG